jgi:HD-GYP domain-containing protein (c-di-GMP phosphodiesterase class II)
MNRIRVKTYLTVLPIVAAATLASGFVAFFESRSALTQVANRHLAYKAEQLRDYIHNEWSVIEDLGLTGDPAYRIAAEESFRSYAYSVLRSKTERVFVFDRLGMLLFGLGGGMSATFRPAGIIYTSDADLRLGWFEASLFGEERVGIAFGFEPFGWTITMTELRSRFFSEVDGMLHTHIGILAAAILLASAMSAVYLGYLLGPLERLSSTIDRIEASGDLSLRAGVENEDEIGRLGRRFNSFVGTIEQQRSGLRAANLAEQKAAAMAVQRESETLFLLSRISDYKDEDTGAHLTRIGELSLLFSRLLGQSEEDQDLIKKAAPLHDIGKIGVPEAILLKPGKLSADEMAIMRTHTSLGHSLLMGCESRYLQEGAVIALNHHEKWDGTGYPSGLCGTAIPLAGRIVSILDVYDALISERPYKAPWTHDKALAYIVEQSGRQFDPELVKLFHEHFESFMHRLQS